MNLLPKVKYNNYQSIAEDLISIRPDETWEHAIKRHKAQQHLNKINKILNRKGK